MSVRSRVVLTGCLAALVLIVILRLAGYAENAAVAKAWAVGSGGTILHFDGQTWKPVPSGVKTTFVDISGTGPNDVWAVGGYGVMHWDGKAWSKVEIPVTYYSLYAVWARTPSDVWVGGDLGVTIHFDGRTWTKQPLAGDSRSTVYHLQAAGPNDVWGLGAGGAWIIRWNGERWTDNKWFTGRPAALWVNSSNDAWLSQQGTIFRWNGKSWSREGTDARPPASALLGYGPDEMWACGDQRIMRRRDGVWQNMTLPDVDSYREAFHAMARARNGRAFAVGSKGMILQYDGATWRRDASGTEESLTAVWAY